MNSKEFFKIWLIKILIDPMSIMLLIAAIISAITSIIQGEDYTDTFIIL